TRQPVRSKARPCSGIKESELGVVPVLANVVDHGAGIDALCPRARRPVVEETGVPAVVSIRAAAVRALEAAAELANRSEARTGRNRLDIHVGHVGFIPRSGERSPSTVAKPLGLEDFNSFEVPGAQD